MRKRHGFTLIELLVAMALIIFIMSILSYAFVAATTAFRDLKAVGDMSEKLRSARTVLQRDLAADHFDGRRRLSDANFWVNGPPRQGFFRIWHGSAGSATGPNNWFEGTDLDGVPLYRSTDHALHFTSHLRGNRITDFFSAQVPGLSNATLYPPYPDPRSPSPLPTSLTLGPQTARFEDQDFNQSTYNSQWAEVVYFLRPALDSNGVQDTANGTPLFTLYRRQLLLVPDNSLVQTSASGTNQPAQLQWFTPSNNPAVSPIQPAPYLEVSCWQGYPPPQLYTPPALYFNSPFDVTEPQRRFGMDYKGQPINTAGQMAYPTLAEQSSDTKMQAADVLLTDVVSFDVRVLLPNANTDPFGAPPAGQLDKDPFVDLFNPAFLTFDNGHPLYTTATPGTPRVFDTWSSVRDPLASIFNTGPGTPLATTYLPFYDYSTWGQKGGAVSMPLWNGAIGPRILAIQIQLRVWDAKTQQTRQVTIVQAM